MLNMLRRLDRIRFRGHRREDFLDLAESPNASDTECGDEIPLKTPRPSPRDSEELRDPVSMCQTLSLLYPLMWTARVLCPLQRRPGRVWTCEDSCLTRQFRICRGPVLCSLLPVHYDPQSPLGRPLSWWDFCTKLCLEAELLCLACCFFWVFGKLLI